MLVLLWPLYNSVYPIPDFPRNLWPYVVIGWIFAGAVLMRARVGLVLANDNPKATIRETAVGERRI